MKMLFAFLMLSTSVMAAEKPSWGTSLDAETKTVTLDVFNNDDAEVNCKYSLSYLVNVTSYKRQTGKMVLAPKASASVSFENDRVDQITRVRAKVSCE